MTKIPKALCNRGEPLTAPWGWVEMDMDEGNVALLPPDVKAAIAARARALLGVRLCADHWVELLEMVEEFCGLPHEAQGQLTAPPVLVRSGPPIKRQTQE
ncbi:MAG: hypothetical protein AMJ93_16660 [Anaerolineae bacterium SM23_84]|nr:MAG: hypothetical protein AMJ93_16660 [Anaerolineae bacterium SM23_84]